MATSSTLSAILLALPAFVILGCHGTPPGNLGARDGKLAPCPATPNCVSSQSPDAEHHVAPLPYTGPPAEAMARIKAIVLSFPRTRIVTEKDGYLHVEAVGKVILCYIDAIGTHF